MKRKLPHYRVFTRIARSRIHGVGVIAIRHIKKGTKIFFGDDAPIVWVDRSKVKLIEPELRRLYDDFCIVNNDLYGCPKNFNQLTVAWYLNHSDKPNVRADIHYDFYALRDINKGQELTVDYDSFSDY